MQVKPRPRARRLSGAKGKCLAELLAAELNGAPAEIYTWRARNARRIALAVQLRSDGMLDGNECYHVTFLGLMNAPGKIAAAALSRCEKVFKVLKRHYPLHPKEPLVLAELARQARMTPAEALQSARFLSRSPASLSVHEIAPSSATVFPNESFVTLKGFVGLKKQARDNAHQSAQARRSMLHPLSAPTGLVWPVETAESDLVRDSWRTAVGRIATDPAGAITAARALVEAACKHVIEDAGVSVDNHVDLPVLYRTAAALLNLAPQPNVEQSLRQVLQGATTIVNGLAHLRNSLGDAHGKGRDAVKPARRHAELVVMLSGAVAAFLLATQDAQRLP